MTVVFWPRVPPPPPFTFASPSSNTHKWFRPVKEFSLSHEAYFTPSCLGDLNTMHGFLVGLHVNRLRSLTSMSIKSALMYEDDKLRRSVSPVLQSVHSASSHVQRCDGCGRHMHDPHLVCVCVGVRVEAENGWMGSSGVCEPGWQYQWRFLEQTAPPTKLLHNRKMAI